MQNIYILENLRNYCTLVYKENIFAGYYCDGVPPLTPPLVVQSCVGMFNVENRPTVLILKD